MRLDAKCLKLFGGRFWVLDSVLFLLLFPDKGAVVNRQKSTERTFFRLMMSGSKRR